MVKKVPKKAGDKKAKSSLSFDTEEADAGEEVFVKKKSKANVRDNKAHTMIKRETEGGNQAKKRAMKENV